MLQPASKASGGPLAFRDFARATDFVQISPARLKRLKIREQAQAPQHAGNYIVQLYAQSSGIPMMWKAETVKNYSRGVRAIQRVEVNTGDVVI